MAVWLLLLALVPLALATPALQMDVLEAASVGEVHEDVVAYWTEERMANAIPMHVDLGELEAQGFGDDPHEAGDDDDTHEDLIVEGSWAEEDAAEDAGDVEPEALGVVRRADYNQHPFRTAGKLYFSKPGGGNYVCSAQFVGDRRVILTAAHCVHDGKKSQWYRNFLFRRAFNAGWKAQLVGWRSISIFTAYYSGGPRYQYDYAFMNTNRDSNIGWMGMRSGIPYHQFESIGYPSNYESGQRMQRVTGRRGRISGGVVQMTHNPMGKGCSGGAWIGALFSRNYAISVNSHYYGSPNPMYGPYFNHNTFRLYFHVRDYFKRRAGNADELGSSPGFNEMDKLGSSPGFNDMDQLGSSPGFGDMDKLGSSPGLFADVEEDDDEATGWFDFAGETVPLDTTDEEWTYADYGTSAAGAGALAVLALVGWRAYRQRRGDDDDAYHEVGKQDEAVPLL